MGNDFVDIDAGNYFSVALRSDGSIESWGNNNYGQVSDAPLGNDFVKMVANIYVAGALRKDITDYKQISQKKIIFNI